MRIETDRLIIRSIERGDEVEYAEMAKDGSLGEIGFDERFSDWMDDWINEALELTRKDNPREDYIPCTIVLKSTGDIVGNVGCTYYEDTGKVGICYFAGTQFPFLIPTSPHGGQRKGPNLSYWRRNCIRTYMTRKRNFTVFT